MMERIAVASGLPVPGIVKLGVILAPALALSLACGGSVSQVASESPVVSTATTPPPEPVAPTPAETSAPAAPAPEAASPSEGGKAGPMVREAVASLKSGNLEGGRERLEQAVRSGEGDAVAYYNLAAAEMQLADLASAEVHAQKAVDLCGGKAKAVKLLYEIMTRRGRIDALATSLERLREQHPDNVAAMNAQARLRIVQNRPGEALNIASEALKKDEANIEVIKTIALSYMAMDRLEAARFVLSRSQELSRDAEVMDMLGQIMMRQGENRKAIVYLEGAIALNPGLADAHNNLGVLYHIAGDHEAAAREFGAAIKSFPAYSTAYMNLGNALRKSLDFPAAKDAYKKAINIDPACADCYFNLGLAELEDKGQAGQDEPSHYRRAIEYLRRYKDTRAAGRRDDDVDKYIDEARRMQEYLEKQERVKPEPPPEPSPPAPAPAGGGEAPAPGGGGAEPAPAPAPGDGSMPVTGG